MIVVHQEAEVEVAAEVEAGVGAGAEAGAGAEVQKEFGGKISFISPFLVNSF